MRPNQHRRRDWRRLAQDVLHPRHLQVQRPGYFGQHLLHDHVLKVHHPWPTPLHLRRRQRRIRSGDDPTRTSGGGAGPDPARAGGQRVRGCAVAAVRWAELFWLHQVRGWVYV